MFLLIDECCAKALSAVADSLGHAAQRTVEVPELGHAASDQDIFAFATGAGGVVVTVNQADFIRLADRYTPSCGLILIPAVRGADQVRLFRSALGNIAAIFDGSPAAIVRLMPDGDVEIVRA